MGKTIYYFKNNFLFLLYFYIFVRNILIEDYV